MPHCLLPSLALPVLLATASLQAQVSPAWIEYRPNVPDLVMLCEADEEWWSNITAGADAARSGVLGDFDLLDEIAAPSSEEVSGDGAFPNFNSPARSELDPFADFPTRFVMYEHRGMHEVSHLAGSTSANQFEWKSNDGFTITGNFTYPTSFITSAEYALSQRWSVFSEFSHSIDDLSKPDEGEAQLLYELNRLNVGLRYQEIANLDLLVGVGFAFEQQLLRSDSLRNLETALKPTEGVLTFISLRITF